MNQSFSDFEVLVIGDHCTDDSEQVVAEFKDERLRFVNLALNFGDQSGPNNVGIELARGRYVAFLNQDDLWLPDHLEACLHWLQATGADIVHGIAARVSVKKVGSNSSDWVAGMSSGHAQFDPVRDFAPCSTWLARREVFEKVGGFRPALELIIEPSQDLLFRIWRNGLSHRRVPNLSVIVIPSGERTGSYVSTDLSEHEAVMDVLTRPNFRAAILSRIGRETHSRGKKWRRALSAILLRPLAWIGIPPRIIRMALLGQFRRGAFIRHLRKVRGLESASHTGDMLSTLKAREACLEAENLLGQKLEFGVDHDSGIYLGEGWSHPENGGRWTDGSVAKLRFLLERTVTAQALLLEIEASPFLTPKMREQRLTVHANGQLAGQWSFTRQSRDARIAFNLEKTDGHFLELRFSLPNALSPKSCNMGMDERKLALFVRSVTLGTHE